LRNENVVEAKLSTDNMRFGSDKVLHEKEVFSRMPSITRRLMAITKAAANNCDALRFLATEAEVVAEIERLRAAFPKIQTEQIGTRFE
jgi:hypothetical protein